MAKLRDKQEAARLRREAMLSEYERDNLTLSEVAERHGVSYTVAQRLVSRAASESSERWFAETEAIDNEE